ncbi:MAG: alanine dehydrogenase, partial [archaeon]|nr:alanine dehydrogenase [archaeon]
MIVGIPKEIKPGEGRVSLTPSNIEELINLGHQIIIEQDAGKLTGFSDEDYVDVGAKIISTKKKVYSECELLVKVKEPVKEELNFFNPGPTLFSFLHLSAEENLTRALVNGKATALAFESLKVDGELPILMPMSEIAGRMSVLVGSNLLSTNNNGYGLLLGGTAGIHHGHVVVLGGGTAGKSAAMAANGLGAQVIILEKSIPRIRYLNDVLSDRISII